MSISLTQRGFRRLLTLGGEGIICFDILSQAGIPTGAKLRAVAAVNPMVEIPSDLQDDHREKALIEVERTGLPSVDWAGSIKDQTGNVWRVWNRQDNPATFTVKFWIIKVESQLDGTSDT